VEAWLRSATGIAKQWDSVCGPYLGELSRELSNDSQEAWLRDGTKESLRQLQKSIGMALKTLNAPAAKSTRRSLSKNR
jgi:hypothetical protein